MKSTLISLHPRFPRHRGFALIVTLSLMILLTVIAVGLLSLSSITLRSSSRGDAMQSARANARMALILAIGDLQKQLGPDTRISATADQVVTSADPGVSSTPQPQRQWAGSYKAWPAALPGAPRPAPEFLQWFVSGNPLEVVKKDFAATPLSTMAADSVEIVTAASVGATGDTVRVPLLTRTSPNGVKNRCAWWVSDLGTKALMAPARAIPSVIADTRSDQQGAPAFNLKGAVSGPDKPFAKLSATDPLIAKIASWQSSALLASDPKSIRGLFHDFTAQSRGLLTDVRKGGFRKDLSMELERPATSQPNSTAANNVLYTAGSGANKENGINLQELWVYYNLHKEVKRTGSGNFTTGGSISSGSPYLQFDGGPAACQADDEFYFKQPVITSYQLVFSFQLRVLEGTARQVLHLVADPVLTFWNPLDVPVVLPAGTYLTVKYWQIPYDLFISLNGTASKTYPFAASLSNASNSSDGDSNFLSLQVGQPQPLVFKPGEVIKISQSGNTLAKSGVPDVHKLAGQKGFNYGGGYAVPVRDRSGAYIDLKPTDSFTFQAKPNNLTAGATSKDGNSITGGASHTRHFSLTHHEYYVGDDRGNSNTSLGIGGMFIDWDFGNRRLKQSEDRGQKAPGIPGTKPSGERLYANNAALKSIFITIPGRPMPASNLTVKQPFMLQSFNAKTENSSNLGTRTLARFNPKALHVDFYDLSPRERDLLPYEYVIESLDSWKNRSLEVSVGGNAYFGGGLSAADGTSFVTTHSVPREPIVSLAAFQHSFANGFDIQKPKYGYGTLNAREPMLPQISHAIGNSMACPVIPPGSTEGSLPGGRPMADHSYLANQALWDEWFLSGITPQTQDSYSRTRPQKTVASEFFAGTGKLPVARYLPDVRGQDSAKLTTTYFSGATPSTNATLNIASLIRVEGMFNVNSTSVEAWKSLLGARKERPVVVRDANGKESIKTGELETPVAGLLGPMDLVSKGNGSLDSQDPDQWVGRRTLTDVEIDQLARAIVKEVRKRGPFLSLADFVNRRVGADKDLARAGAIQNALDASDVSINSAYRASSRTTTASARFDFPEAEQGPYSLGIPGIVKQADILTPIAPILSARSDSFLIRAYGENTDAAGKVIARAWCEAVVQRSPEFIDSTDAPEKAYASIKALNKTFGRRFEIVSFRWLSSAEA